MPSLSDPVQFRDDMQREALGHELRDVIEAMENEHSQYFNNIDVHRSWRDATPDVAKRRTPWVGASNLVVPIIAVQADAMVARILLQLFSASKLWFGTTENETFDNSKEEFFRFLNYTRRKLDGGFFGTCEGWIDEQQVIGSSITQQVWCKEERWIMPPRGKKPIKVNYGEGPRLYHLRREQVLYPRETVIEEAPIVVVQKPAMWSEMARRANIEEGWDKEALEECRHQSGIEGITGTLRDAARKRAGLQSTGDPRFEPHDLREVWVDFPFLKQLDDQATHSGITRLNDQEIDHITVPIVVYLHMKTAKVLRAIYAPYLLPKLPFYEITRKRTTSRGDQNRGLAKDLEHFQRGITTVVNQAIDAITFGNSLKVMTSDKKLVNREWSPNLPLLVDDINTTKEMTAMKAILPEMQIIGVLQAMAERSGGASDPTLGRESKMGGHPSPATNFVGMLQQSQMQQTRSIKSVGDAVARVGEDRALLYQQTGSPPWLGAVMGEADAEKVKQWLEGDTSIYGTVSFEVHTLSEMHNPDAELRKAVAIDQMVTNYHVKLQNFTGLLNPQAGASPEQQREAQLAIESLGKTLTKALEAAEVDEVEDFVFKLQENMNGNLAQLAQAAALAGGGGGVPPVAGGPGNLRRPAVGPVSPPPGRAAVRAAGGGGSGFNG